MEALVLKSAGAERFRTFLVMGFGFLATFLALVGVFGVTARSVATETGRWVSAWPWGRKTEV